jgi:hypothetical protein
VDPQRRTALVSIAAAVALIVRHWQGRGKGAGSMLQEVFHGDIASS